MAPGNLEGPWLQAPPEHKGTGVNFTRVDPREKGCEKGSVAHHVSGNPNNPSDAFVSLATERQ